MGAKSKSGNVLGARHKRAAKRPKKLERGTSPSFDAWEDTAQDPDSFDDGLDCERIVQGDDARTLSLYFDDYN